MLRRVVTDEIFWEILKNYREKYMYSSANTEDFKEIAEETSGKNLNNFFDQWIYGENFPEYNIELNKINDSETVINISQVQNGNIFNMPLDLLIITNIDSIETVSYTHLTLPTIYSV